MSRVRLVRFWLPIAVCSIGVAMLLVALLREDDIWGEGGALMLSAGLSIWLLNALHRVGVRGDRERDREVEAREYFDRHGRWPDEPDG